MSRVPVWRNAGGCGDSSLLSHTGSSPLPPQRTFNGPVQLLGQPWLKSGWLGKEMSSSTCVPGLCPGACPGRCVLDWPLRIGGRLSN